MSVCADYVKQTGLNIDNPDDIKNNLYNDGSACATANLSYCADECSHINKNQERCFKCLQNPITCPSIESKCRSKQVDCSKTPDDFCCKTPCCPHVDLAVNCARLMNQKGQDIKQAVKRQGVSRTEIIVISVCSVIGVILLIVIVVVVVKVQRKFNSKQMIAQDLRLKGNERAARQIEQLDTSNVDPEVLSRVQNRLEQQMVQK